MTNYGDQHYSSSSYRKMFGDSPRSSTTSSPTTLRVNSAAAGSRYPVGAKPTRSLPGASSRCASASTFGYHKRDTGRSSVLDCLDLTQASAVNNEFKLVRTSEKEQLQGLNDRFATFIDKVRYLEQQNNALEGELVTLRRKQQEPSRVAEVYQQELRHLRAQVEELNGEKNHVLIEREAAENDLEKLSAAYDNETRARKEVEQTLKSFRKDVDDATLARLDLERKVDSLSEEIGFLKRVHLEEMHELSATMQASAQGSVVDVALPSPDLTSVLKEIRNQYECVASRNLQASEEWYKSKLATLNVQATRSSEAMRAGKEEMNEFRRQLQSRTLELETLRGANESLERLTREMEDTHGAEIVALQDTIGHLDSELQSMKSETVLHLREYQELLNIKMALDIEIAAYRKLLEGEETHFSSGMSFGSSTHGNAGGGYTFALPRPYQCSTEKQASPEGSSATETVELKNGDAAEINSSS